VSSLKNANTDTLWTDEAKHDDTAALASTFLSCMICAFFKEFWENSCQQWL